MNFKNKKDSKPVNEQIAPHFFNFISFFFLCGSIKNLSQKNRRI